MRFVFEPDLDRVGNLGREFLEILSLTVVNIRVRRHPDRIDDRGEDRRARDRVSEVEHAFGGSIKEDNAENHEPHRCRQFTHLNYALDRSQVSGSSRNSSPQLRTS